MAGFTKSSPWGYFRSLFGDGALGDVTIASNTNLPSVLNGAIVERNYRNLTINTGAILSVANPCKGLLIRVNGVLTLNGIISMSNKGCYIDGGGSDLPIVYSDIKIPAVTAAGAPRSPMDSVGGNGGDGTNGQCGGGGAGGGYGSLTGGAGAVGCVGGGGAGGSGCAHAGGTGVSNVDNPGENAPLYGLRGGNGQIAYISTTTDGIDWWMRGISGGGAGGVTAGSQGGAGAGSGGILIIMANEIVGSGSVLAKGANGGNAVEQKSPDFFGSTRSAGGGGSGGGSIVVFYNRCSWAMTSDVSGGLGGSGFGGKAGGRGGNGSFRAWSTLQLASHPRL